MDWDEISKDVEQAGGLKTFQMETLRNAAGAAKLGANVRAEIKKNLAKRGLGHVPVQNLPSYQHEQVRLYKRGTTVGDLMEAAVTPGPGNDSKLLEALGSEDSKHAEVLAAIRELLGD